MATNLSTSSGNNRSRPIVIVPGKRKEKKRKEKKRKKKKKRKEEKEEKEEKEGLPSEVQKVARNWRGDSFR